MFIAYFMQAKGILNKLLTIFDISFFKFADKTRCIYAKNNV